MSSDCVTTIFRAQTRRCQQAGESGGPGRSQVSSSHHLAVWLREVAGPDWLLYCQLYSERRDCWVSERWAYSSSSSSPPSTLFTDLVPSEAGPDLHLVLSLYRLGRMTASQAGEAGQRRSSSSLGPASLYKRPVAVAVSSLAPLLTGQTPSPEHEITDTVKLFSCEEKEFNQLHSMIIRATGKVSPLTAGLTTITLKMRIFTGFLADVRAQHLDLKDLPESRKLGFAPVIMPGDWRNDLFVTLVRGQFDKGKPATSARNIEVVLSVFSGDGKEVGGAVVRGPSNSGVFYHNNNPCWEETFRLEIPVEIFQRPGCHLRLEFYHCSVKEKQERKLVGFSWLEVMTGEGTVIQDGEHELVVFRTDSVDKLSCGTYLNNEHSLSKSGKESVVIRTKLCSTKLTQNVDLMSLLKWRRATPSDIPDILDGLMKTGRVARCSQIYHFPHASLNSLNIILLQRLSLQFLFKISNIIWNICNRLSRGGGDCQVFTRRPGRSLLNVRY